jgi:predicted tellurium resistance membrane protein TerC
LKYGLALVLLFIGFKMLGGSLFTIPTLVSLIVVTVLIGVPVLLSLLPFKKGG